MDQSLYMGWHLATTLNLFKNLVTICSLTYIRMVRILTVRNFQNYSNLNRVFYIFLVFSNAHLVLSQCNTQLRLLSLLIKML